MRLACCSRVSRRVPCPFSRARLPAEEAARAYDAAARAIRGPSARTNFAYDASQPQPVRDDACCGWARGCVLTARIRVALARTHARAHPHPHARTH
jgi:hypothetical protein